MKTEKQNQIWKKWHFLKPPIFNLKIQSYLFLFSHKLWGSMDGTQFLWLPAKHQVCQKIWRWVYPKKDFLKYPSLIDKCSLDIDSKIYSIIYFDMLKIGQFPASLPKRWIKEDWITPLFFNIVLTLIFFFLQVILVRRSLSIDIFFDQQKYADN